MDEKREKFEFDRMKKSEAISLATLVKKTGVVVEFLEEAHKLDFQLNLSRFSFNEFEISFHRLLEDVTGEVWLLGNDFVNTIGFKCENSKGQVVMFTGWANNMLKEGHLNLTNFTEYFFRIHSENNQIEWSLIQKVFVQLNGE